MSYQPQTEAATSRFLNVEEAGKTLRTERSPHNFPKT